MHWSEVVDIYKTISVQLRKSKTKKINAGMIKNKSNLFNLFRKDEIFASFKNIRGTPQYFKSMQLDMIAKIRCFGTYTFFITGSAADFFWPELIIVIARQYGSNLTIDEVEQMSMSDRRMWLARNPVTAARHIDFIFTKLWKDVILSGLHPVGQILNYDVRKEFQARGAAHFHSAVHVKDAPKLGKDSDESVIHFIDKYIFVDNPFPDDVELQDLIDKRQRHYHTRTCKRKMDASCRFQFPHLPIPETLISGPRESGLEFSKAVVKNLKSKISDQSFSTLNEFLLSSLMSYEQYKLVLGTSEKKTIILKRSISSVNTNPFNPYILKALRANMDIQFIVDAWSCIAYITSYICKPEKSMSKMMRNAVKESDSLYDQLKSIGSFFEESRSFRT